MAFPFLLNDSNGIYYLNARTDMRDVTTMFSYIKSNTISGDSNQINPVTRTRMGLKLKNCCGCCELKLGVTFIGIFLMLTASLQVNLTINNYLNI
jgi:hypothetical protein